MYVYIFMCVYMCTYIYVYMYIYAHPPQSNFERGRVVREAGVQADQHLGGGVLDDWQLAKGHEPTRKTHEATTTK